MNSRQHHLCKRQTGRERERRGVRLLAQTREFLKANCLAYCQMRCFSLLFVCIVLFSAALNRDRTIPYVTLYFTERILICKIPINFDKHQRRTKTEQRRVCDRWRWDSFIQSLAVCTYLYSSCGTQAQLYQFTEFDFKICPSFYSSDSLELGTGI